MADADDFDVEELRRLIRGESPATPSTVPKTGPRATQRPKPRKKAPRPAADARKKRGGNRA